MKFRYRGAEVLRAQKAILQLTSRQVETVVSATINHRQQEFVTLITFELK